MGARVRCFMLDLPTWHRVPAHPWTTILAASVVPCNCTVPAKGKRQPQGMSFFPHGSTSAQATEAAEAIKSWRGRRVQSQCDQECSKHRKQDSSVRWRIWLLEEDDCCIRGRHWVRQAVGWTERPSLRCPPQGKSKFWWQRLMMAQCVRPQGLLFKQCSADCSKKLKKDKLKHHQSKAQEWGRITSAFVRVLWSIHHLP